MSSPANINGHYSLPIKVPADFPWDYEVINNAANLGSKLTEIRKQLGQLSNHARAREKGISRRTLADLMIDLSELEGTPDDVVPDERTISMLEKGAYSGERQQTYCSILEKALRLDEGTLASS